MRRVSMFLNGAPVDFEVDERRSLADVLRDDLRLTGTNIGCEQGVCGSCTVIVQGAAIRSCLMLAVQCEGKNVRTIEGIASGDELHPVQQAFHDAHALQCGFCTPGFVTLAVAELERDSHIDRKRLVEIASSNLCRCTGYESIIRALEKAAAEMQVRH